MAGQLSALNREASLHTGLVPEHSSPQPGLSARPHSGLVPAHGVSPMLATLFRPALALCALLVVPLTSPASAPAPSEEASRYEVQFMEGMIDHHAMAVRTADLCLQRATHAELIELCNQIKTTQTTEINWMQSWLEAWYDVTHKPSISKSDREHLRRMSDLSGAEFEIAFMRMMIEHHQMAIVEASDCLVNAYHQDLIELCGSIASAQAAEIVTMRSWLCEWYDVCLLTAAPTMRPQALYA
jgi:uncharacterized protein (DUF305 family)